MTDKYILTIDGGKENAFTKEYTREELEAKKDYIAQTYAGRYRVDAIGAADTSSIDDNASYTVKFNDSDFSKTYTGAEFKAKRDYLEQNYAGRYDVETSVGSWDDMSQVFPSLREQLDTFRMENRDFMNDIEARREAAIEASKRQEAMRPDSMRPDSMETPSYAPITTDEWNKYSELLEQEEALKKAWYTSDEYLLAQSEKTYALSQMQKQLQANRLAYAQANPVNPQDPYASRGAEADAEMENYETAERIMHETVKLHNAPSKYGPTTGVHNMAIGAGDELTNAALWTAGLSEIADNLNVRGVLSKVQKELGNLNDLSEESIENILTPAEKAVLQAWAINVQTQLERSADLSRGYQAGKGAVKSLEYMAEFALTGGVGNAAAESVEQMTKWLAKKTLTSKVVGMADEAAEAVLKNMAEKTASSAVRRYGKNLGLSLAEAAGRTGVMPSTFRNISEKATEIRTDEEGNNYLVGMNNAFASGLADSFIETLSEGGRVGALGELFGDVAGKIPFYKRMVDRLSNSKAGELWDMFQSSGVMNTLRAGGWHGIGEEYLEEWYGNALRTLTGVDKEALKEFATWDNQLVTVTSFLPLTIFGGTVSTAQVLSAQRGLDKKAAALRSALIDRGYDEAQADNYIDIMKGASPAEISSVLSPIAVAVAGRSEADARALVKPFMDFAMAVRKWQSFDTKYKYQEQEQRDALQQQMEDTLGKFWQEDETGARRVQRAVNAKGEAVYLLGKQSAADAEAGIPASVPAVTADGRKMFVNPSEYQLEDELDMNTFLGLEVMAEKGNTERARMLADQERSIQQIRQMSAPGTQINLGTAEAPVIATVAQRHPDGVIVTTPDEMARQLTYEELGNYIGINATPLTDAQLDEQEADALLAEQSQREAELDQEYGYDEDSAVEIAEAEEEIVQSAEAVTELPMDSQGNVDETALWNEDPARWAAWNDEQRQDGGTNSVTAINAAMTNLSGQIAEQEAAYAAMPVGTERNDLEKQINANKARLSQLVSLQQGYAAQAEAALQAAAQEQAALSASQAQMTEQQMDEMDAQYEGIYSQTRSLNERARLLQEYLDKISVGTVPVVVLTKSNYAQAMKDAGCPDYLIRQVGNAFAKNGIIEGFMAAGKAFIVAESIPTIDRGRQKYVHERQHVLVRSTDYVSRILATGVTREQLKEYVRTFSGTRFYDNYGEDVLADELLSFAMELVYTYEDFSVALQKLGLSEDLINVIKSIDDEQSRTRNGERLSQARRRRRSNYNDGAASEGGSRQNDGDLGQVSSGLLGQQNDGSLGYSQRGAGDREGGEGAAEPAVDNENNPAFVDATSTDAEGAKFSAKLTDSEIDNLVEAMKANAEVAEVIALTPENWEAQFGAEGIIETPVGEVKMGPNQVTKLFSRNREEYFGMIKPTLTRPDVVVEKFAPAEDAERDTKYVFIKSFVKPDGSRIIHFESVTVQKEGREVSVSSHEAKEKDIKKEMQNGKLLHLNGMLSLSSEGSLTEAPIQERPDLVPTSNNVTSDSKDSENLETPSESERFSVITPEMDAEYLAAVERGDMETAQRMVIEAARLAGYDSNSDYQGTLAFNGAAPSGYAYYDTKEERIEAWESGEYEDDQTLGDYKDAGIDISNLGWSLTSPVAQRTGNEYTRESIKNLADAVNSDSRKIKVYRAVDADIKEDSVRNGDWVTPSRAYAEYHIRLQDWKEGRIIEQEVDIDDIWWDGNDINEWGYNDGKGYVYKNTPNNRKLLAPVTYDDAGNVIPLSERFNPEKSDIRFSVLDTSKAELKDKPIKLNGMYRFKLQSAFKGVKDNGGLYPYVRVQLEEVPEDFSGKKIVYNGMLEGFAIVRIPYGLITEGEKDNVFFIDPKAIENELWEVLRATENYHEFMHGNAPYQRDWLNTEGNVLFSVSRGSLAGMHNISEEKLRKVIKQGGSANPSTAVIDIERQAFDSYGEISLIMPSSLVDAETGRNAGTFTADAWTPTYPQIEKRFSVDELQRAYWRDITAIPEEMQHEVRMAFDSWLDNRTASGLAYMFLQERGEAPEMVRIAAKFPQEIKDKMSAILGEGRTGFYELSDEEKQAVLDLYIQENFGGSREDFDSSIAETIQRIEDRLSTGKVPSFVEKRITADLQWMKEHGYNYDNLSDFVRGIVSDIRHAGEVNAAATTNRAVDYIKDNNLSAEYEQWKESLNDRYGIKEYLFDGYTPSGNPRWLPNTVENASKLMNKQGLAGATGMASSFNRFVATLAPKKKSLSDIRSSKDLLVEDEKLVDDFRNKWSEVFFDLGIKCQPDAKGYEDYGLARLTEAAQKKNPGAYLKKEYGVELSQEDLQRLADMIKAIKTEFPARYFETKFQRPVYLNEFAAAVIPTTTSADIKQAIAEAGLPIFEYDSSADGARREATLKATDIEGVRFSVFEPHNATVDEIDGLFREYNMDESLVPLYDKVSALAHTMDLKIRFDYPWSDAAGSTFGDKVKFNTEFFNSLAYKSQDKAHALLHEMIHATTNYAIAARNTGALTEGMKEAVSQLEGIYGEIVNDRSFDGTYGARSIYEMVAELSNPEFRNLLKEKNLFQRIVDAIKRLLGIEVGENALDNLSATLDYMLDNYDGRVFGAVVNQYQKHQEYTRFSAVQDAEGEDVRFSTNNDITLARDLFNDQETEQFFINKDVNGFNRWLKKHSEDFVILYHGTGESIDVKNQGLLKTSKKRRRSYQSTPGYVYLSLYPSTARLFGEIAYPYDRSKVYAVTVKIKDLKPDTDQLANKRYYDEDLTQMGNTLAESLIYGSGARVKRNILPYEISEDIRFSIANESQAIFVSNAARAVDAIKMEKATPAQWLAMIEKNGGLKAGEDKWMGLSEWLKASDKKTLTKAEVLDFVNENMIFIEEEKYGEVDLSALQDEFNEIYDNIIDNVGNEDESNLQLWEVVMNPMERAWEELRDRYSGGDDFDMAFSYDSHGNIEINDPDAAGYFLGVKPINDTRLDYTTSGLQNKQEIALVIPAIEPWNESDEIHFGDAGEGRAVAWIRFGETKTYAKEYADFYAFQEKMQQKYFPDRRISALSNSDLESLTAEEKAEFERLRDIARSIPMKERTRRRVLVIDEIQSKRHQEGREKGYRVTNVDKWLKDNNVEVVETGEFFEFIKNGETDRRFSKGLMNYDIEKAKRLYVSGYNKSDIPDAPFDKNWHELAMKRMLRYAAEEGYDAIAWTKGEQQAERYDIGSVVTAVDYRLNDDGTYKVDTMGALGYQIENVPTTFTNEQELADVFGKEIAKKIVSNLEGKKADIESANREALELREKMRKVEDKDSAEYEALIVEFAKISEKRANAEKGFSLSETDFRIGGEGMKGFYDKILPAFMNKYGKKWGIKVADITLPNVEKAGRVMHSVPVTEEMKESVMEGQVMFSAVQIDPAVRQEMDTIKAKAMWDGTFMKAPNGADTNLTEDQWLMVRTNNFKNWFGDWINDPANASKIVDENGEPMVMYHGTSNEPFTEFKREKIGTSTDIGYSGKGFYFSSSKVNASSYLRHSGNDLMQVFLNIRNPYVVSMTDKDLDKENTPFVGKQFFIGCKTIEEAREKYDGLVKEFLSIKDAEANINVKAIKSYLNEETIAELQQYDGTMFNWEGRPEFQETVATSPNQIKSATETTGLFSESEDIRYSSRFDVNTNPTEAQKKAGNYKMGHLRLDGYNITIENPKGSVRRGTDSKGNEWENTLNNDYGYIRGTEGVDGDHIDVYLSDNPAEGNVFVIDQVNPETREFDEHKVMYGFNSMDEARKAYLANFSEGWNGLGTITEVTKEEFRKWIDSSHRKTKPFSEYKSVKAEGAQSEGYEEEDITYSALSTPTDEIVAEGMKFSIQDFARLAGNIFQNMPESFRKEAIEETFKRGWDMQSAIFQIPARLAEKESWDESDKDLAKVIRNKVQEAMDESRVVMSRPLTTKEALWMLYRSTEANGDSILDAAKRAMVAYNLGFDKGTLALEDEAKEAVKFSAMRDATVNAKASMYNRGAVNVWTRLKESFVDMNASVEELVSAIEERTGKKAKGFENIVMALNQQASKGFAAMESYEIQFLNPMFDEIRKIMNETGFTYEDIVRYVILKHGLERNEKLAQRDARSYYQEIYDDIIDKIRSMNAAQKRTYLTNAQLRDADAKAELARLQSVDTSAMSADEKREHKMNVKKAQTAVNEAAEHLERAQKIASMSEKEAEDELQMHFDAIAAQTDNKYNELRKNDYSGITSMFYDQLGVNRSDYATEEEYQAALMDAKKHKYDTLGDVEGAADMEVKRFEGAADTKGLWKRINAATKETLRQQYEANMISKEQYDNLRGMFEYYVPLRGFKDNTAEDMYTYYRRPNSTGYTKPILAAEGRKTEAESPFGWIASMAGSAIASNVKNEAKLALYYFVSNRPENGIATVSKTWYVHTPGDVDERGKRIFRPAYPTFSEDLSTEEAKDRLEQWQEQMRELKKQGLAYESGQKLNLGNAVVNISDANKPEHIVNVKVAGKDYTIIINGNPRAAQAINGDLNIEATAQDYSAVFGPILRWMSSVNTSYNPEFWITNMMRDMAFTWMAVNTKESPEYRRKFRENYRKAFSVIRMVAKNEKGTLGDSYLEKMYKEFVDGGGVTGYTQIKDNETWEKEIEKYLSSNDPESIRSGKVMKGVKTVFHAAHRFGESLEQVSRFAAFLTSREMGKSMAEAVNDAKEITVNFNRKGSGKMISLEEAKHLTDRNGKPLSKFWQWVAVAASSISPLGRRFIMFFNAAIQGLNATYKLYKANPKRMIGWTLAYASLGMMNAVLHAFMDDDDDYLDIPQYERRNSLMIGGGGVYLKWALPQEARAFYALGDIAVESIMGRNPHQNVAGEIGKVFAELLPINPSEGWKAFLPSIAVPAFELLLNEDYKGDPIYNEMKWLTKEERERTAKWSNAKKGTGKTWVLISQGLNNVTGGDMYDAGLINIQPEKMEHLVQSAFGGTIRTLDKFITTVIAMIDPEEEWTARQTPFLNRVLTINDERFRNVHVNDVFDFYRAEAEHAISLEKKYTKAKDSKALRELRSSDEYRWAKIYIRHRKALENINDKVREAEGTRERKELMKQQDELKKKMIKEFSSAR